MNQILQRGSIGPEQLFPINRFVVGIVNLGCFTASELEAESQLGGLNLTVAVLIEECEIHIGIRLPQCLGEGREQGLGVFRSIGSLLILVGCFVAHQIRPVCMIGFQRHMDNTVIDLIGGIGVARSSGSTCLRSRRVGELPVGLVMKIL